MLEWAKTAKENTMFIVRDVITHASIRKMEWVMAGMMIHLGWILSQPQDTFNSDTFQILESWMTESNWAVLFGLFGLVRLVVLILNGTHIKQSAEIRMVLSGVSFIILVAWVWGIDAAHMASTGSATYKWLAIGELMNIWQASSDIRTRRIMKNGRT